MTLHLADNSFACEEFQSSAVIAIVFFKGVPRTYTVGMKVNNHDWFEPALSLISFLNGGPKDFIRSSLIDLDLLVL